MSRGKRNHKKGLKTIKLVKNKDQGSIDSMTGVAIPPNLRPIIEALQQSIEKRARYAEMKAIQQNQKLVKMIDEIKANQTVLQTILAESKIIDNKEFMKEYKKYINEVVGIVENGRIDGIILIDTFNIGAPIQSNSLEQLRIKVKNPIFINRS